VLPTSVADRLEKLAPDQRAAATAPPGPILCVAPAGSGKTTTLVARIAWLVATGASPAGIVAVTFNKRAADEMASRLDMALKPLDLPPGAVRVKTFHALGREILVDGGGAVEPLLDREAVLRDMWPDVSVGAVRILDDAFSRLKLDVGATAAEVGNDPEPGPIARAFLAYEAALADQGGLDFDDLVARALRLLEARPRLLTRWRGRCEHLLVDETQDVDRSQLRLALLLAAPANRIFLVGDDDQTIYGWRLADVRRILALAESLPGLRRIDLTVNYRCPRSVVQRAVRLVAHNEERFIKTIRASPAAEGRLILAPDGSDETVRVRHVFETWPADGGTRAILARTNAELLPAAAAALDLGLPFCAPRLRFLSEDPRVDAILAAAACVHEARPATAPAGRTRATPAGAPAGQLPAREPGLEAVVDPRAGEAPLPRLVAAAWLGLETATPPKVAPAAANAARDMNDRDLDEPLPIQTGDLAAAMIAWAAPYRTLTDFTAAIERQRRLVAELRRDDAALTLATAHSTKGLEFDHVAVIGLDAGRFPSARSIRDSPEPDRALQEERRLAYVAWTRARRSLTLVYDPTSPSQFLLEAFSESELGLGASRP
jgi:DNA helicase-2/ATP-dependent DNA helicase PcrA